ncbi:DNA repair protein RadA [Candidatus Dependentiae bacterium]|nr:DNA repair protein RadA [Candidatus Dependentiae bacterium]
MAKKNKLKYLCNGCGYETSKWLGKCPSCGIFNSLVEIEDETGSLKNINFSETSVPVRLTEINSMSVERVKTGVSEFDALTGGGLVNSSLILIGGSPGIGKSTLMLQILEKLSGKSLYIAGEESPEQIKLRADRVKINNSNIVLVQEIEINKILEICKQHKPDYLIIDSIQTVYNSAINSAPGSIIQVRESTLKIMEYSKKNNIISFIIGHITKTGDFAGPRVLEHMVDTVLYFEGDKSTDFRILRSVKNRFGSTNEIAVFEMTENGLSGISNYANLFFFNRKEKVPGVANSVIIEGSRPILIEIQALVTSAIYGNSRRITRGFNSSRLSVIIAIIEKHCGMSLIDKDVFVNITGGLEVEEPAVDLSVAVAIISSVKNRPLDFKSAFIGELGLTGEVRSVSRVSERFKECKKNGIYNCILSEENCTENNNSSEENVKTFPISNIKEILKYF